MTYIADPNNPHVWESDGNYKADHPAPSGEVANNVARPVCPMHNEEMVLTFYDRPGGPPGNGYNCRSCAEVRGEAKADARAPQVGEDDKARARAFLTKIGSVTDWHSQPCAGCESNIAELVSLLADERNRARREAPEEPDFD